MLTLAPELGERAVSWPDAGPVVNNMMKLKKEEKKKVKTREAELLIFFRPELSTSVEGKCIISCISSYLTGLRAWCLFSML